MKYDKDRDLIIYDDDETDRGDGKLLTFIVILCFLVAAFIFWRLWI